MWVAIVMICGVVVNETRSALWYPLFSNILDHAFLVRLFQKILVIHRIYITNDDHNLSVQTMKMSGKFTLVQKWMDYNALLFKHLYHKITKKCTCLLSVCFQTCCDDVSQTFHIFFRKNLWINLNWWYMCFWFSNG